MNVKKGDKVIFKGYEETPEDGADLLVEGNEYEVAEVNKEDGSVAVIVDNPDFNPKKKESESNARTILTDIFFEELELPKGSKAKPAAKTPAKKAAAKSKAPVKSKAKAKAKEEEAEESDDPYGDLDEEQEDQEILGLVNDAEDILELARETVEETSALEYKLGGVLFHVRKSGAYKELDERYAEKGGFALYLLEHLNIEYRKAMYLVDIYYKWNKFGLEPEKVAQIGWAKAAKIAAVMDEDTAEELIELAENNTVADLVDHIKTTYKEVGGTKGEKKVIKLFKFKLAESAGIAVEEVLQSVAAGMGLKNLDEAFEHIVMEWSTEHPIEAPAKKVSGKAATKQTNGKARSKA